MDTGSHSLKTRDPLVVLMVWTKKEKKRKYKESDELFHVWLILIKFVESSSCGPKKPSLAQLLSFTSPKKRYTILNRWTIKICAFPNFILEKETPNLPDLHLRNQRKELPPKSVRSLGAF